MAGQDIAGKILKGINGFAGSINIGDLKYGDKTILESNKAINKIGKFVMGEADTGIRGTLGALSEGKGIGDALKSAYGTGGELKGIKDLNWKAAAGTYVGAAAAGRILTGGGIYRDSTGNVNVPVVPFI